MAGGGCLDGVVGQERPQDQRSLRGQQVADLGGLGQGDDGESPGAGGDRRLGDGTGSVAVAVGLDDGDEARRGRKPAPKPLNVRPQRRQVDLGPAMGLSAYGATRPSRSSF